MALASQSPRSTRQFQPSQRFGTQFILLGAAAVASLGAGWWLMRADAGSTEIASASPAALASSVPAASGSNQPMRAPTSLDAEQSSESAHSSNNSSNNISSNTGSALDNIVADAGREAARGTSEGNAAAASTPFAATNAQASEPSAPTSNPPATTPSSAPSSAPASTPPATNPSATPEAPANDAQQAPKKSDGMKQNGITQGERPAATPAANAGSPAGNLAQGLPLAASEPVKARAMLSSALLSGELSPLDAKRCSEALVEIGRVLAFTPVYNANDPMFFQYTVQSGDSLEKIVRRHKIGCDWRLVQRINNIKKPEAIRVGQRLKLPKGPFSAVVSKRDYRVDICVGAGNERVVLTSLPCGLGSANGTPTGNFKVRVGSKLLNPEWTHPVTGEHFAGDDPKNPIGEHWLGLEGTDTTNAQLAGYGIHGTIDIDSIGQDRSLGCVRLLAEDVALVWECLGDGAMVEIRR
jgi:LysM repeat protein/cytoskeletal protein RodZ